MNNFEKTSAQTPENATINPFLNTISKLPFAKQAMFIASFSALVGCGGEKGGDPTPTPYKDTEKPKITATAVVVSDLDGDGVKDDASFNVKATDNKGIKALDVFVNGNKQNVEENGDVKVLNVPEGTNTRAITAIDTSNNEKKLTDTFERAEHDPTVTANAELIIHEQNIKEDMPIGTEVIDLNATFTVDGQTKTVAELQALGYEVIFTTDNGTQITIEQLKGLLAQILNVDGENNTNPAEKANLVANFTLTVKKNGVVKATQALNLNQKIIDVQNFTNQYGHLIELADGTTAPQYTNTVNNAHNLIDNLSLNTDVGIIDNIIAAGGSRFTRTMYNIAGLDFPYLTIDGKRLRARSMSWLLDAVDACRLNNQTAHSLMTQDQQVAQKIADALKTLTFVDFDNPSDPGGQIQIDSKLTAAKIGAGATVNYNIDNGNY